MCMRLKITLILIFKDCFHINFQNTALHWRLAMLMAMGWTILSAGGLFITALSCFCSSAMENSFKEACYTGRILLIRTVQMREFYYLMPTEMVILTCI